MGCGLPSIGLKNQALLYTLSLAALCALAAPAAAVEVRVGAGADIIHREGMKMVTASVGPVSFLAWDNRQHALALSYRFGPRTGLSGAVGGLLARRTDEDLGTRLNFALQANYCGEVLCLGFMHISHGSSLGLRRRTANSGLNFLFLEYRPR